MKNISKVILEAYASMYNEAEVTASKPGKYGWNSHEEKFTGRIVTSAVDAKVENAKFEIKDNGGVAFYKGTWHDGTANFSEWYGGTWKTGTWKGGIWYSGSGVEKEDSDKSIWQNGLWKKGTFGSKLAEYEESTEQVTEAEKIQERFKDATGREVFLNVVKKVETGEWVVRVSFDGKYNEDATYYTDDKADAVSTMAKMKENYLKAGDKADIVEARGRPKGNINYCVWQNGTFEEGNFQEGGIWMDGTWIKGNFAPNLPNDDTVRWVKGKDKFGKEHGESDSPNLWGKKSTGSTSYYPPQREKDINIPDADRVAQSDKDEQALKISASDADAMLARKLDPTSKDYDPLYSKEDGFGDKEGDKMLSAQNVKTDKDNLEDKVLNILYKALPKIGTSKLIKVVNEYFGSRPSFNIYDDPIVDLLDKPQEAYDKMVADAQANISKFKEEMKSLWEKDTQYVNLEPVLEKFFKVRKHLKGNKDMKNINFYKDLTLSDLVDTVNTVNESEGEYKVDAETDDDTVEDKDSEEASKVLGIKRGIEKAKDVDQMLASRSDSRLGVVNRLGKDELDAIGKNYQASKGASEEITSMADRIRALRNKQPAFSESVTSKFAPEGLLSKTFKIMSERCAVKEEVDTKKLGINDPNKGNEFNDNLEKISSQDLQKLASQKKQEEQISGSVVKENEEITETSDKDKAISALGGGSDVASTVEKFFSTVVGKETHPFKADIHYWINRGDFEAFKDYVDNFKSVEDTNQPQEKVIAGAEYITEFGNYEIWRVEDFDGMCTLGNEYKDVKCDWDVCAKETDGEGIFDIYNQSGEIFVLVAKDKPSDASLAKFIVTIDEANEKTIIGCDGTEVKDIEKLPSDAKEAINSL